MKHNFCYSLSGASYDERNLPVEFNYQVNKRNLSAHWRMGYDSGALRIYKADQLGNTTHFVRDVNGTEPAPMKIGVLASYYNGALRYHGLLGPDGSLFGQADGTSRYYFLKDHPSVDGQVSGSVRTTVDFSNTALGYDDYYPFGKVMPGRSSSTSTPDDDYKFTGHQRDAELDLDYMLARNYDPLIGRFMQVDPLAMDYPSITPYGYVLNNPLGLVDSDGKQPRPPYSFGFDFKTTFQSLLSNYDPTFLGRYARAESYGQLEMEVAVDALDAGIATADAIAFAADNIETVALASSLLPIAAGAGLVNTIADATSVGLEYQKASFTNSSFSDANSKALILFTGQVTRVIGRKFIQNTLTHFNQSTRSDKAIPLLQEMQKIKSIELGSKAASKASILILDDDEMQNKR